MLIAVDGTGLKSAAQAWVGATPAQEEAYFSAAKAVAGVSLGLVALWVTIFIGLTGTLYGVAVSVGKGYPRWLGWPWVLFGLASIGVGLSSRYMTTGESADIPEALWFLCSHTLYG